MTGDANGNGDTISKARRERVMDSGEVVYDGTRKGKVAQGDVGQRIERLWATMTPARTMSLTIPAGTAAEAAAPPLSFRWRRTVTKIGLSALIVRQLELEEKDDEQILDVGPWWSQHGAALWAADDGAVAALIYVICRPAPSHVWLARLHLLPFFEGRYSAVYADAAACRVVSATIRAQAARGGQRRMRLQQLLAGQHNHVGLVDGRPDALYAMGLRAYVSSVYAGVYTHKNLLKHVTVLKRFMSVDAAWPLALTSLCVLLEHADSADYVAHVLEECLVQKFIHLPRVMAVGVHWDKWQVFMHRARCGREPQALADLMLLAVRGLVCRRARAKGGQKGHSVRQRNELERLGIDIHALRVLSNEQAERDPTLREAVLLLVLTHGIVALFRSVPSLRPRLAQELCTIMTCDDWPVDTDALMIPARIIFCITCLCHSKHVHAAFAPILSSLVADGTVRRPMPMLCLVHALIKIVFKDRVLLEDVLALALRSFSVFDMGTHVMGILVTAAVVKCSAFLSNSMRWGAQLVDRSESAWRDGDNDEDMSNLNSSLLVACPPGSLISRPSIPASMVDCSTSLPEADLMLVSRYEELIEDIFGYWSRSCSLSADLERTILKSIQALCGGVMSLDALQLVPHAFVLYETAHCNDLVAGLATRPRRRSVTRGDERSEGASDRPDGHCVSSSLYYHVMRLLRRKLMAVVHSGVLRALGLGQSVVDGEGSSASRGSCATKVLCLDLAVEMSRQYGDAFHSTVRVLHDVPLLLATAAQWVKYGTPRDGRGRIMVQRHDASRQQHEAGSEQIRQHVELLLDHVAIELADCTFSDVGCARQHLTEVMSGRGACARIVTVFLLQSLLVMMDYCCTRAVSNVPGMSFIQVIRLVQRLERTLTELRAHLRKPKRDSSQSSVAPKKGTRDGHAERGGRSSTDSCDATEPLKSCAPTLSCDEQWWDATGGRDYVATFGIGTRPAVFARACSMESQLLLACSLGHVSIECASILFQCSSLLSPALSYSCPELDWERLASCRKRVRQLRFVVDYAGRGSHATALLTPWYMTFAVNMTQSVLVHLLRTLERADGSHLQLKGVGEGWLQDHGFANVLHDESFHVKPVLQDTIRSRVANILMHFFPMLFGVVVHGMACPVLPAVVGCARESEGDGTQRTSASGGKHGALHVSTDVDASSLDLDSCTCEGSESSAIFDATCTSVQWTGRGEHGGAGGRGKASGASMYRNAAWRSRIRIRARNKNISTSQACSEVSGPVLTVHDQVSAAFVPPGASRTPIPFAVCHDDWATCRNASWAILSAFMARPLVFRSHLAILCTYGMLPRSPIPKNDKESIFQANDTTELLNRERKLAATSAADVTWLVKQNRMATFVHKDVLLLWRVVFVEPLCGHVEKHKVANLCRVSHHVEAMVALERAKRVPDEHARVVAAALQPFEVGHVASWLLDANVCLLLMGAMWCFMSALSPSVGRYGAAHVSGMGQQLLCICQRLVASAVECVQYTGDDVAKLRVCVWLALFGRAITSKRDVSFRLASAARFGSGVHDLTRDGTSAYEADTAATAPLDFALMTPFSVLLGNVCVEVLHVLVLCERLSLMLVYSILCTSITGEWEPWAVLEDGSYCTSIIACCVDMCKSGDAGEGAGRHQAVDDGAVKPVVSFAGRLVRPETLSAIIPMICAPFSESISCIRTRIERATIYHSLECPKMTVRDSLAFGCRGVSLVCERVSDLVLIDECAAGTHIAEAMAGVFDATREIIVLYCNAVMQHGHDSSKSIIACSEDSGACEKDVIDAAVERMVTRVTSRLVPETIAYVSACKNISLRDMKEQWQSDGRGSVGVVHGCAGQARDAPMGATRGFRLTGRGMKRARQLLAQWQEEKVFQRRRVLYSTTGFKKSLPTLMAAMEHFHVLLMQNMVRLPSPLQDVLRSTLAARPTQGFHLAL